MNQFDITDRVAVVTGGAGLLGRSHGAAMSAAGANVVLGDIRLEAAEEAAAQISSESGRECVPLHLDVADPASVRAMAKATLERFGKIDILINNAALNPKFDPKHAADHSNSFEEFPFDEWEHAMDVNVTGMFLCAQAVAPAMVAAGNGVIVNISSTYGLVGPDQRLYEREGEPQQFKPVTYSVSKSAALGLTRYLATYYAGKGIRVNTLTPGGVFADHDDEFVERYSAKTLLGRMAEKEEISSALLFLVSDASSYMTGANLVVDGGWTAW